MARDKLLVAALKTHAWRQCFQLRSQDARMPGGIYRRTCSRSCCSLVRERADRRKNEKKKKTQNLKILKNSYHQQSPRFQIKYSHRQVQYGDLGQFEIDDGLRRNKYQRTKMRYHRGVACRTFCFSGIRATCESGDLIPLSFSVIKRCARPWNALIHLPTQTEC